MVDRGRTQKLLYSGRCYSVTGKGHGGYSQRYTNRERTWRLFSALCNYLAFGLVTQISNREKDTEVVLSALHIYRQLFIHREVVTHMSNREVAGGWFSALCTNVSFSFGHTPEYQGEGHGDCF